MSMYTLMKIFCMSLEKKIQDFLKVLALCAFLDHPAP